MFILPFSAQVLKRLVAVGFVGHVIFAFRSFHCYIFLLTLACLNDIYDISGWCFAREGAIAQIQYIWKDNLVDNNFMFTTKYYLGLVQLV